MTLPRPLALQSPRCQCAPTGVPIHARRASLTATAAPGRLAGHNCVSGSPCAKAAPCLPPTQLSERRRPPPCMASTSHQDAADALDPGQHPAIGFLIELGFEEREVRKMLGACPELADEPVDLKLRPLARYLTSVLGGSANLRRVALKHPRALLCSLDRKARPAVEFLAGLGLDSDEVAAAVVRFPRVLQYSVKGELAPQVAYLVSLGVEREEVGDLVKRRPQVLGVWIEPVVRYLSRLGVKRRDIGKLLASFPIDYSVRLQSRDDDCQREAGTV